MSARPLTDKQRLLLQELDRHAGGTSAEILAGQLGWDHQTTTFYLASLIADHVAERTHLATSALYRTTRRGRMQLARGIQLTLTTEELARVC